ncbi:unnamed protein product, partial [Staurois parvus]
WLERAGTRSGRGGAFGATGSRALRRAAAGAGPPGGATGLGPSGGGAGGRRAPGGGRVFGGATAGIAASPVGLSGETGTESPGTTVGLRVNWDDRWHWVRHWIVWLGQWASGHQHQVIWLDSGARASSGKAVGS